MPKNVCGRVLGSSAQTLANFANHEDQKLGSLKLVTKIQDRLAEIQVDTPVKYDFMAVTIIILESLPGSIVLTSDIPMWLLRIVTVIVENTK